MKNSIILFIIVLVNVSLFYQIKRVEEKNARYPIVRNTISVDLNQCIFNFSILKSKTENGNCLPKWYQKQAESYLQVNNSFNYAQSVLTSCKYIIKGKE